jgi:hypothetical protein
MCTWRIIFRTLLGLAFFLQAGCEVTIVNGGKLEHMPGIPPMRQSGSAAASCWVKDEHSPRETDPNSSEADLCRIKYDASCCRQRWMAVEGTLDTGRTYPVVLDTGASVGLFVNDLHVVENKLAIRPLGHSRNGSVGWGVCRVPALHLGRVVLQDPPCFYREQHTELRLLGIPLARDKAIIAGLGVLRQFSYIAFDSVSREVEFSVEKVFKPEQPSCWANYSFVIDEDLVGNAFLLVTIPIAGHETQVQLDTGSGRGLAISEDLWKTLAEKIGRTPLTKGRDLYPYIGLLPCRRGVIPKLSVGNRIVKDAMISIFPDDSPLMDRYSGLLGMQLFQDTVVVLDFKHNLMWVKNPHPG